MSPGRTASEQGQPSTVRHGAAERARRPGLPADDGAAAADSRPGGRTSDPCQAPAKSPRVTCASPEPGAPGLVWVPAGHSAVLSGRAAASVGTRGRDAKAAGSRRTQEQRTRAAMATPTQLALRGARGSRFPSGVGDAQSGAAEPREAVAAPGGPWRHCALGRGRDRLPRPGLKLGELFRAPKH